MQAIKQTRAILAILLCVTMMPLAAAAESAKEINAKVDSALKQLYEINDAAKSLSADAKAILVFPEVLKGGLIVGGATGNGALRIGGETIAYYRTASASIGLQAGIQTRKEVIMFMTENALNKFRESDNWQAGVDGSVAVIRAGAGGAANTKNTQSPIIGFIFGNEGLYGGLNFEGAKISPYKPD